MYDQDHHDESDEYGFWANVPERRFSLPRRTKAIRQAEPTRPAPPAQRSHGSRSTRQQAATAPVASVRSAFQHVDPLIRRSGMLALVVTLFIPLALALRSGDASPQSATLRPEAAAVALMPAASGAGTGNELAAADPAVATDPYAGIDIAALPEAVPVNQVAAPARATASEAPAESDAIGTESANSTSSTADAATPTATTQPAATARTEQATARRASCSNTYTVASGDAWVLIAKKVGTTTAALLAANNATRRTMLHPGRTVCLPKGASVPTPTTVATTKAPGTTAPATPPTTVATRPANNYSKAQAEQIIREVWPDQLEDRAVFLAKRESNLTPNVNNYCCYGLFQIYFNVHKKWLAQIGVTSAAQLWDPRVNAYAALVLYNRSGSFAPWGG